MGAVDAGVVGQRRQPLQAAPHLLRRALEQPPAAQREQGVADEGDMVGGVEIGDVAQGMAAALDHLEAGLAQHDRVAAAHLAVDGRELVTSAGPTTVPPVALDDLGVAAGVVGVPVGVEDQVELPAERLQLRQDRAGVRRVDAGGEPRGLVEGQEAVVVLKAGELVDVERHAVSSGRKATDSGDAI